MIVFKGGDKVVLSKTGINSLKTIDNLSSARNALNAEYGIIKEQSEPITYHCMVDWYDKLDRYITMTGASVGKDNCWLTIVESNYNIDVIEQNLDKLSSKL